MKTSKLQSTKNVAGCVYYDYACMSNVTFVDNTPISCSQIAVRFIGPETGSSESFRGFCPYPQAGEEKAKGEGRTGSIASLNSCVRH
jgi:hypothetical protein